MPNASHPDQQTFLNLATALETSVEGFSEKVSLFERGMNFFFGLLVTAAFSLFTLGLIWVFITPSSRHGGSPPIVSGKNAVYLWVFITCIVLLVGLWKNKNQPQPLGDHPDSGNFVGAMIDMIFQSFKNFFSPSSENENQAGKIAACLLLSSAMGLKPDSVAGIFSSYGVPFQKERVERIQRHLEKLDLLDTSQPTLITGKEGKKILARFQLLDDKT